MTKLTTTTRQTPRDPRWAGGLRVAIIVLTLSTMTCGLAAQEQGINTSHSEDPVESDLETEAVTQDAATEPDPESPTRTDLEYFKLITERNIFDPNRRPNRPRETRPTPREPEPQVDIASLTGTLQSAQGEYAFFDSESPALRKTVKVGDPFAGFVVKGISQSDVVLEAQSNVLEIAVGQALRRVDDGEWSITTATRSSARSSGSTPSRFSRGESSRSFNGFSRNATTAETATATSNIIQPSSEGPSEALRRLLEQRQNEGNQ